VNQSIILFEKASGFCYINDVVIAIFSLTNRFDRILYVDLDVHHCDGVQEAFYYSNRIVTLSFHRYGAGFFPGTGSIDEIGEARGIYHSNFGWFSLLSSITS